MRSRKQMIYFTIYLLLGTAAVVSVQGQPPAPPPHPEVDVDIDEDLAEGLDVVVPQGRPKAISDWALAGVVWSNACLVRKLASEAAVAADNEELADRYRRASRRAERLINALEGFGWRRISRRVGPGGTNQQSVSGRIANRSARDIPPANLEREPRKVAGATLVPEDAPVEVDIDQWNYRLEGAGDAEPEIFPQQVEKGMEEAIADAGVLRPAEFGDNDGRISYRESQTRSGTMPYSFESIYDTDDYDPDVDFRSENPLVVADPGPDFRVEGVSPEAADDSDDNVADMYGFEDPVDPAGEDLELNPVPVEPANLLDRLAGVAQLEQYSDGSNRYQADADWVQLHLNLNQLMWQRIARTGNVDAAMDLAQLKLANSITLAKSATNNPRLKSILANVAR